MELKNLIASLKKTLALIWDKTTRAMFHSKKYPRFILGYFQTSETIFLLFFATLIGVGAGFGAIIFRWMITFFQNLFFSQGQHTLAFLGSYYVIIIPAIGGVIVGLLVYFFAREAKGHGVPEVMLAVANRWEQDQTQSGSHKGTGFFYMYWFRWISWKGRTYCSNKFRPGSPVSYTHLR